MTSPIEIEVTNKLLASVAEEMGIVLRKAAFSANIKERRDFSCAVFDSRANLLAQAAHIPVHLGAMPATVKAMTDLFSLRPGDIVISNDPFLGGTHLPDITLMSGVFDRAGGSPLFYLVTRAHHADVGGIHPGSMSLSISLDEEGVLIPPALLVENGHLDRHFLKKFLTKVRHPDERKGDLRAQIAALDRGKKRLLEILDREGTSDLLERFDPLLDYGERVMQSAISRIPDGEYPFEDFLDDDGIHDQPVPIRVKVSISGSSATADFSSSSGQVKTGLNTVRSVACSAAYYVFFCLVGEGYPINEGSLRPLHVKTRKGTILDARPPAPVAAGNVETSQRIVDCLLGALAQAAPELIPAASCGSMNNIAIGGRLPDGGDYAYYETIGGGMGARPGAPGLSGIHTHMTNTLNTPIEALEQAYPFMVERYSMRHGSGGRGKFSGGDGIIRGFLFSEPAIVTLLTERRKTAPYGLAGGRPGKSGKNILIRRDSSIIEHVSGKTHLRVKRGDLLEIHTPGGGGWGDPTENKD